MRRPVVIVVDVVVLIVVGISVASTLIIALLGFLSVRRISVVHNGIEHMVLDGRDSGVIVVVDVAECRLVVGRIVVGQRLGKMQMSADRGVMTG